MAALGQALAYLRAPTNALGFALRRRGLPLRRIPQLKNESKQDLFSYLPEAEAAVLAARERDLRARYQLQGFRRASTRLDYRDGLWRIAALETALEGVSPPRVRRVVDVGSKNFSYVLPLLHFVRHWSGQRDFELHGVEVDPGGVYVDGHTRAEYAAAYLRQAGAGEIHFMDFLDFDLGPVDLLTWFFPFVTREALLWWGLPLKLFRPGRLLDHALALLAPGGILLAVHQTPREQALWCDLLEARGLVPLCTVRVASRLTHTYQRATGRRATVLRRALS
ncbi:MAG: hypothetical protein D6729_05015 [Deltaproteobacteria bacterium]|nr:MAG: hypothetical protein D6729_05015 [Deltaproteobacteria bacterium]